MAAPASKTIGDLSGKWVMNKTLSDNPEPGLALQGIGYLTRKAIGLATVTLHAKQYTDADGVVHIDIEQTATGGIKGTSEHRTVNNATREHSDWLFGHVVSRATWSAAGADALAAIEPVKEHGVEFLAKGWLDGEAERTGPDAALHVVSSAVADGGWTATQVWGFQTIGGERRYARNIVLKKGDQKVEITLVYDFIPE
ncbi:hypothetical protein JX265_004652 [Neoarthrinium moseri]|uniref:Uncharacterized protein n=1 Tax=Neoarthrinium moseri TaxID=1658444 RepID=A0A9P9WPR6_9PEZI|nr:uncharacterized protein JN550_003845 [Neoarthrinium moseri]KAI1840936.1 hypothetical protein JX266_012872 [Neoarthrinium moseri]KAI1872971.1 hypothetical protein JN550_003845 [Neoarthrinium moseri]KAI1874444.1 hypothetical protein JX265_004652 [Neoarthrinium moseri]